MSRPNTVNNIDGRYAINELGCWEWQWGLDGHGQNIKVGRTWSHLS